MEKTQLWLRIRKWISQSLRSILVFFLPFVFVQTYIDVQRPPNQIDEQPSQPIQANNGGPATPSQNRVFIEKKGGLTRIEECQQIYVNVQYTDEALRFKCINEMPVGASLASFFQGFNFDGIKVGRLTFNETYGSNRIHNKHSADKENSSEAHSTPPMTAKESVSRDDTLFDEINRKLDVLIQHQVLLKNEILEVKQSSMADLKQTVANITQENHQIRNENSELKRRMSKLEYELSEIKKSRKKTITIY